MCSSDLRYLIHTTTMAAMAFEVTRTAQTMEFSRVSRVLQFQSVYGAEVSLRGDEYKRYGNFTACRMP